MVKKNSALFCFSLFCILMVIFPLTLFAAGRTEGQKEGKIVEHGKFSIILHKVHRDVSTEGVGGDITEDWLAAHSEVAGIEWLTLGIADIHTKLFTEASLASSSIDLGFVMNEYYSAEVADLFEPLDEYLKKEPIEEWEDVFPNLKEMTKINGKIYSIPFRTTVSGLHFNAKEFKDRGLEELKQHVFFEDVMAVAPKLKFNRPDGMEVFPFLIPGKRNLAGNHTDVARAWDGDFITMDYQCKANGYGMIKAIEWLNTLYKNGLYPRAFTSVDNNQLNTWLQQGRIVMSIQATGKNKFYNSDQGKVAGQIKTISVPISKELSDKYKVAPSKTSLWSLVIPKNARNKDLSWSYIRHVLGKDKTVKAAINGNGPVRRSTYEDPVYREKNAAYWKAEFESLSAGRPTNPAFPNAAKAKDIFDNYAQQAVIGRMSVKEALDRATEEISILLPQ